MEHGEEQSTGHVAEHVTEHVTDMVAGDQVVIGCVGCLVAELLVTELVGALLITQFVTAGRTLAESLAISVGFVSGDARRLTGLAWPGKRLVAGIRLSWSVT